MLDVKWINAQEVTTLRHEQRTFCDRLWLMAPARVEMMTNNTAPGVLRYVRGGSTQLAAYMLESASNLSTSDSAEQIARECFEAGARQVELRNVLHDIFSFLCEHGADAVHSEPAKPAAAPAAEAPAAAAPAAAPTTAPAPAAK
jgi:hypothetical protein